MKCKYLLIAFVFSICANANAEWFLRGTQNAWAAAQMDSAGVGTNTVQLKGVVFSAAGNIKFDRFGDWKENYGVGGLNGANIPVSVGTWDIKFFTDTKNWSITPATASSSVTSSIASSASSASAAVTYHIRGTFNAWAEGTLMTRVGITDNYESCINFTSGDAAGGPRFKIDPNGGWGDAIPAGDYMVSAGWVKVSFNSATKAIIVQQNLPANCAASSSSVTSSSVVSSSAMSSSPSIVYHLRGTFNAWLEGTLMKQVGTTTTYEQCVNFTGGDANGGPRFKIDPNGAWGDAIPANDYTVAVGWVKISFNSATNAITTQQNLPADCGASSVSSSVISSSSNSSSSVTNSLSSSSSGVTVYHFRSTSNNWEEGLLMARIGLTDEYEICSKLIDGDNDGIPRFRIDPNGGWGADAVPVDSAYEIHLPGWARVIFNAATNEITVQQELPENCEGYMANGSVSSSSKSTSSSSSSVSSSSTSATVYHLRGTFNAWLEGTLMKQIGTTSNYEQCINFTGGDANGSPRFKIDPNGGWGDAIPANDYVVTAGWVKISFNSATNVITAQQNMQANCGADVYHLRGTQNAWAEGDLFESVDGIQPLWKICRDFGPASTTVNPRFKVDPNGGWGADTFPATDVSTTGWSSIIIDGTRIVSLTKDMAPNCAAQ